MKQFKFISWILSLWLSFYLVACQPSIIVELVQPSSLPLPSFKIIAPDAVRQSTKFTTIEVLDKQGKLLWRA